MISLLRVLTSTAYWRRTSPGNGGGGGLERRVGEPESETGPSRASPVELGDRRGGRLFISMAKPSESGVGGILGSNRRLEKLSALCFLYVVIHNIPRTVLHGLICVDVHCCYAKLAKQDRHHNHEHKPQNYLDQGHPISSGGSKTRDFVLG